MHPGNITIEDFDYDLPAEKIAVYPLAERDQSKLLIYDDGNISEDTYQNIVDSLPPETFLIFNDTRVINARILFLKSTGAKIEVFLLEPFEQVKDYAVVLHQQQKIRWKCMIGGAGKWKDPYLEKILHIHGEEIVLRASLVEKLEDAYVVELTWNPGHLSFAEIVDKAGVTPLPPYIKRIAEDSDAERYQSIYSEHEGSVAAPTAGLHFTRRIFDSFDSKGISRNFVTLHVGAGTFKPVKASTMQGHEMHAEWLDIPAAFIRNLRENHHQYICCVGTTSVRTVESLFWMGVKIHRNPGISLKDLIIDQWDVYEEEMAVTTLSIAESMDRVLEFLAERHLDRLFIQTRIIIAPGYRFRITQAIVTNFHQPKSTLLLLVAAMIGADWKRVYDYALNHNFRFLSYGDGCLIHIKS